MCTKYHHSSEPWRLAQGRGRESGCCKLRTEQRNIHSIIIAFLPYATLSAIIWMWLVPFSDTHLILSEAVLMVVESVRGGASKKVVRSLRASHSDEINVVLTRLWLVPTRMDHSTMTKIGPWSPVFYLAIWLFLYIFLHICTIVTPATMWPSHDPRECQWHVFGPLELWAT